MVPRSQRWSAKGSPPAPLVWEADIAPQDTIRSPPQSRREGRPERPLLLQSPQGSTRFAWKSLSVTVQAPQEQTREANRSEEASHNGCPPENGIMFGEMLFHVNCPP